MKMMEPGQWVMGGCRSLLSRQSEGQDLGISHYYWIELALIGSVQPIKNILAYAAVHANLAHTSLLG